MTVKGILRSSGAVIGSSVSGMGSSSWASLCVSRRGIRSIIPPRPAVTTLVYLTRMGRPVRNAQETDLSLIRTRDNKFYLQRVLPGGEVVRWAAPGLDHLKHVTNFESYSLNDIDENGGIIIPTDVMATAPQDPPSYHDAVYCICRLEATQKFTRKARRQWHRRLYAHWKENPDKYLNHVIGTYGVAVLFGLWLVMRGYHSVKNNRPFWDAHVYEPADSDGNGDSAKRDPWRQLKRFSDMHPEHENLDMSSIMMSPAQSRMVSARAELRESDFTDPHFHTQFWWKVRHLRYYGHWPKGIAE